MHRSSEQTSAPTASTTFGSIGSQDKRARIPSNVLKTKPAYSSCDPSMLRDAMHAKKQTRERLNNLRDIALEEGIEISIHSEIDLWSLLDTLEFKKRPYLFLLDNGNLRALWKNDEGEQIGIQFFGQDLIQYVLFSLRMPGRIMARTSGRDTLPNIRRQIGAFDLWRLMT